MQIAMQKLQKFEYSGHTGIFYCAHYISIEPFKLQKTEGGIFIQKLCSVLKIYTIEGSLFDHIVNPDSNLVALYLAYEYWQPIQEFNDNVKVQKNNQQHRFQISNDNF
jgi:hypothetical protein